MSVEAPSRVSQREIYELFIRNFFRGVGKIDRLVFKIILEVEIGGFSLACFEFYYFFVFLAYTFFGKNTKMLTERKVY